MVVLDIIVVLVVVLGMLYDSGVQVVVLVNVMVLVVALGMLPLIVQVAMC